MIRAKVCKDVVAKTCDRPVVTAADFDVANLPAPVNRRSDILAASLNPLNGFSQLHSNPAKQSLFRVNVQLRAEASADFGRDDAQFVFRNAYHERELRSKQMRNLRRRPDGEFLFARKV